MKLEINDDMAHEIIEENLKQSLSIIEGYLKDYKEVEPRFIAVFDLDPKRDVKKLKKMRRALKRVLTWYSNPGSQS